MNTHNICFHREIRKIFIWISYDNSTALVQNSALIKKFLFLHVHSHGHMFFGEKNLTIFIEKRKHSSRTKFYIHLRNIIYTYIQNITRLVE